MANASTPAPTTSPPTRKGGETRDVIVRSAFEVVAERGAHRLSMNDIAAKAGVSKALIHYHFGSKIELIAESLEWAVRATSEHVAETVSRPEFESDPLSGLMAALFRDPVNARGLCLAHLDLLEHTCRDDEFTQSGTTITEIIEGSYLNVVNAGITLGLFDRDDAEAAAADVRIVIEGVFVRWLHEEDSEGTYPAYATRCRRLLSAVLRETAAP